MDPHRTWHCSALLLCLWLACIGTRAAPLPDDSSPKETQGKSATSQSSQPQPNNVAKANPTTSGSSKSENGVDKTQDTNGNEKKEPVLPLYLQLIPAFCMVFLFGLGVLIIITIQRAEEKNQTEEEINPLEDDHFGTIWISQLKQVRKKSSIIERLKSPAVLVLGARQKKYELYESMLEKYREDIAIKRQMFHKQSPLGGKGSSKRLKDLAMLHRTKSEGGDYVEDHKGPQWQQELQAMQEEDDKTTEASGSATTMTTPLMNITPPPDSASPAIMNYPPSSNQITIRTSMVSSSADESSSTLSYFQEDREDKETDSTPLIQFHNVSTSSESADTSPLILRGETPPLTEGANRRPLSKQRARPKSWMASISSAATRGKRAFSRPRSLLVSQQAIDEGPELMPLDFDSLLTYKFEHESDHDMAKMITAVEEQMVKEVVQSKHDLTGSEIDALAKLLDDVSRFCKDFCSTEWKNKKQYSLDVVYEQSEEKPAERKLKHQHSLPASYLKRRSLSDSLRKIYDIVLQKTGSRESQLDEVPLLELSTSPQLPTDIRRSPEVENLLTVGKAESKGIARSSEIEDLIQVADSAPVLSVAENSGESERERLTSYEDDVFMTDTEFEQETESPLDLFTAFQQFPKPYVKVNVEIPEEARGEGPDKTHWDVDKGNGTKKGPSLEALEPTPRKRPCKRAAQSSTMLSAEKNSFDQLVDDLFEFGSCSSEASGSGRDEAGIEEEKRNTRENSESSEEEKLQRDSVVFENVIDQNLKSLEFLPSVDSEDHMANGKTGMDDTLISVINDKLMYENKSTEEIAEMEEEDSPAAEEIQAVMATKRQSREDDDFMTDDLSCQFEEDIEPKPMVRIVSKQRPSFITVTSRRIDSVHSEHSDGVATRDGSSPPQDEDWVRNSPLSNTRTPSPS